MDLATPLSPLRRALAVPSGRLRHLSLLPARMTRVLTRLAPTIDQALISCGNFLSGVIAARSLDHTAFGVWVLAMMLVWLTIPVQSGLMLQPLAVNGAPLDSEPFQRYLRANLPLQLGFVAISTSFIFGVAWLWDPLRPVAVPIAAATACLQVQDFCRRVLYIRERLRPAILSNLVNYDLQAALLGVSALKGGLTLQTGLWIVAGTSFAAMLVGLWHLRHLVSTAPLGAYWSEVAEVGRHNLEIGKWSAGSEAIYSASTHSLPAIVATFAGITAAAGFGVITQIMGTMNLLTRPMQNHFVPRAARAYAHHGLGGLNRTLVDVAVVSAPPYLLLVSVLLIAPERTLAFLFGESYGIYAFALPIFAIAATLRFFAHFLELEVHARRLQRHLLFARAMIAALIYTAGLYLIAKLGLTGAGLTMLGAGLIQLTWLGVLVLRARRGAETLSGPIAGGADHTDRVLYPPHDCIEVAAPRGRRCVVPLVSWRIRHAGLGMYPAFKPAVRAYRAALRVWIACGGGRLSHPVIRGTGDEWALPETLRGKVPDLYTASVLVGRPDGTTIAQLMDGRGRSLAYAKYAVASVPKAGLANEANLLAAVPEGIAPRLVFYGPYLDGDLLVQSAVPGRPYPPRLELDRAQLSVLQRLIRPGARYRAADHPFVRSLADRAGPYLPLLDRVVDQLGSNRWPVAWTHGDFTFFNVLRWQKGCYAFDWECGTSDGFPFVDAAYWFISVAWLAKKWPPEQARGRLSRMLAPYLPVEYRTSASALVVLSALHHLTVWHPHPSEDSEPKRWLLALVD